MFYSYYLVVTLYWLMLGLTLDLSIAFLAFIGICRYVMCIIYFKMYSVCPAVGKAREVRHIITCYYCIITGFCRKWSCAHARRYSGVFWSVRVGSSYRTVWQGNESTRGHQRPLRPGKVADNHHTCTGVFYDIQNAVRYDSVPLFYLIIGVNSISWPDVLDRRWSYPCPNETVKLTHVREWERASRTFRMIIQQWTFRMFVSSSFLDWPLSGGVTKFDLMWNVIIIT